jgi:predicted phosphoadenosine phosphosulfate sulfurtransferase
MARHLTGRKRGLGIDVLTAAQRRIRQIFTDFPAVYVSFSGGKDSGVVLELAAQEARRRGRRLGVLIVDLEAQYQHTIEYIFVMLERHADVLDVSWVCVPLTLRNAVSQFQPAWTCWDPELEDRWVRPRPDHTGVIADERYFSFFRRGMEFEELVVDFGRWYSDQHGGRMTACLVAIRSDESLNRYRTIARPDKRRHRDWAWTTWLGVGNVYNAYPIYDWRTEDIWRYYGRCSVPYNKVYDLMHRAGVSIHQARLCQPFGDDQRKGLWLYHILEPDTWTKLLARVQGASFGARYARETGNVLGRVTITKPDGMTWEDYVHALLESMPPPAAEQFRDKIAAFLNWYDARGFPGGSIPDDGPFDTKHPSWRRICKAILTNDYYCRSLSFAPPASADAARRHRTRMAQRRREWDYPGLT